MNVYARFDVTLLHHPKVLELWKDGPAAMGFYLAASLYSREYLLDGIIPRSAFHTFYPLDHQEMDRLVGRLVDVGLFLDKGPAIEIHNYKAKNQTKEQVTAAIERKRKAQEKWKRQSGDNLEIISEIAQRESPFLSLSPSLSSLSPEGVQGEAAPEPDPPEPLTSEDRYAEAYAQGQRDVSKAPFPAPVEPWERGAINRFTTTPGWGHGLRGEDLLEAIRTWSRAYRAARDDHAQYERGFAPKACEVWARGAGWRYKPPRAPPAVRAAPQPEEQPYRPPAGAVDALVANLGRGGRRQT